jgi:hypothetical protein
MNKRKAFFGLLQRRELLVPTWQGLLLFVSVFAGLFALIALNIQPFLSLNAPVQAEVLVVEGWVPDFVLEEVKTMFEQGHYKKIYVTGGPLEMGGVTSGYQTYAELGADTLLEMGLGSDVVEAVPAPFVRRDRTYASALALKNKLHQQAAKISAINLVSLGVHSRRSHLLFQKAFAKELQVGIIAVDDRNYFGERWWKFSEGVRMVTDELFAYLYAILVFPFVEP